MTLLTEIYDMSTKTPVFEQFPHTYRFYLEMEQLQAKLEAAKKGLGLANKLSGDDRRKHQSRVLGNLNRIRARLDKMIQVLEGRI